MNDPILIRNGTLVTMDQANSVLSADLLISGRRISAIGEIHELAPIEIDARIVSYCRASCRLICIFARPYFVGC